MKKILIASTLIISLIGFNNKAKAQYRTGIGVHGGLLLGLTVKQYMNTNADQSVELLILTKNNNISEDKFFRSTAFYAWNKSVRLPGMQVSGLNFHFGPGLHADYFNNRTTDKLEFGADAQVGFELLIGEIPFSIGVDVNPYYQILRRKTLDDAGRLTFNGGLVLRYLID